MRRGGWTWLVAVVICGCSDPASPAEPSSDRSTLTANPLTVLADGRARANLIVTVRDGAGRPLEHQPVTLAASGDDNRFSTATGETDSQGVFVSALVSSVGGAKTVTASFGPITLQRDVQFTPLAARCGGTMLLPGVPFHGLFGGTIAGDLNGDGYLDLASGTGVQLGRGNGTFQGQPTSVSAPHVVVDLDGDSKLDRVVASSGVTVQLGVGDGTFQTNGSYAMATGMDMVTGDFDNDQNIDVASEDGVMFGRGDGSFDAAVSSGVGTLAVQVAAGDFNGDGRDDIVAIEGYEIVRVALTNADRTFQVGTLTSGTQPQSLAVADVDRDSHLDVIVMQWTGELVANIYRGIGDGTFAAPATFSTNSQQTGGPYGLSAIDINGDNFVDLVAFGTVLYGNGDGTFGAPVALWPGARAASAGDVDADGDIDVIFGEPMIVAQATGAGTFLLQTDVTHQSSQSQLADFDNDGFVDVLLQGATPVAGTLAGEIHRGHGDGTFDPAVSAPFYGMLADFNRDGMLDIVSSVGGGNMQGFDWQIALGHGDFTFDVLDRFAHRNELFAIADVTRDGRDDLVMYPPADPIVLHVLPGKGDGTFDAPIMSSTFAGFHPSSVGDFDGDGALDIASTHGVMYGAGDGTFTAVANTLELGSGSAVGDLDGDGLVDILAAYSNGSDGSIQVYRATANRTFGDPETVVTGSGTVLRLDDLDRDGLLDIVGALGPFSIRPRIVRPGTSDIMFGAQLMYPSAGVPFDVDRDGDLDLVAGTEVSRQSCLP